MEPTKMGEGWKPTGTGVLVPPGASAAPSVERATFAVKVQGFAPPPQQWDIGGYEIIRIGHVNCRPVVMRTEHEVPAEKPRRRR